MFCHLPRPSHVKRPMMEDTEIEIVTKAYENRGDSKLNPTREIKMNIEDKKKALKTEKCFKIIQSTIFAAENNPQNLQKSML